MFVQEKGATRRDWAFIKRERAASAAVVCVMRRREGMGGGAGWRGRADTCSPRPMVGRAATCANESGIPSRPQNGCPPALQSLLRHPETKVTPRSWQGNAAAQCWARRVTPEKTAGSATCGTSRSSLQPHPRTAPIGMKVPSRFHARNRNLSPPEPASPRSTTISMQIPRSGGTVAWMSVLQY